MDPMLEAFTCPICLDLPDEAVTTNCCNQVFCKSCLVGLKPPAHCPSCRSNSQKVTFKGAVAIQRALDRIPVKCPNSCTMPNLTRGDLKEHTSSKCLNRTIKCPSPNCTSAPIPATEFAMHFATTHGDFLISNVAKLYEPAETNPFVDKRKGPIQAPLPPLDIIRTLQNSSGRASRLGRDGMRYCGGPLPRPACGCCDGHCGPTSGCPCVACMVLELNLRKLPPGWLINKDGASCRRGTTGSFYCGRKKNIPGTDGWCGPTNGPQCSACAKLERLSDTWYRAVDDLREL